MPSEHCGLEDVDYGDSTVHQSTQEEWGREGGGDVLGRGEGGGAELAGRRGMARKGDQCGRPKLSESMLFENGGLGIGK